MRSPQRARAAHVAPRVAGACLLAFLAGCAGGHSETESAIQREEGRPYGSVVVRSQLAPKRATLGDPVRWTLTATLPAGSRPATLGLEPPRSGLEVEPEGSAVVRTTRSQVIWSRRFEVRGFDLGMLALPSAVLPLVHGDGDKARPDTLAFPADSLGIDSLTTAPALALEPDRGPIDPGWRAIDIAIASAIALVIAAALVALFLAWRRRRSAVTTPVEVIPPERPFLAAIEALRREGEGLARDVFHERLSEAVRRYVSEVTGVDALDRTTRELERELRVSGRARSEAIQDVVRLLRRSDLVKFARRPDDWADARALLDDAVRLAGAVALPAPVAPTAEGATIPARGEPGTEA